jgi:hypothetical protein
MAVIVDNNVPTNLGVGTNQDECYVTPRDECLLFEDPLAPTFIRAEQVAAANLGVLIVAWEYFAYTFSRYTNAMSVVRGTSMVTPVF